MQYRRNFPYDVKLINYECTKSRNIVITFYNDIHHLLDCDRVSLVIEDDRIVFKPGDGVKNSIKISGEENCHKKLMTSKNYTEMLKFVGVYDLQYDSKNGFYYISTETQKSVPTNESYGYKKGLQQSFHNVGSNCGPRDIKYDLKKAQNKEENTMNIQAVRKTSAEKNAEAVVVSALLQLMETQLKEEKCAEALATLTTLKNYI